MVEVLDLVDGLVGIDDAVVGDRGDTDRDIVAHDDFLRGTVSLTVRRLTRTIRSIVGTSRSVQGRAGS